MLEDSYGCSIEFIDKRAGGIDVEEVVIGDFFAVNLLEEGVEVAVITGNLMGVLAIAKCIRAVDGYTEMLGRIAACKGKPVEDCRVIT